jgi:hypothetical protein
MLPADAIRIARKKFPKYAEFEGKVVSPQFDMSTELKCNLFIDAVNEFDVNVEFAR